MSIALSPQHEMEERQGLPRKHHLLRTTKLPAQKVVLFSVENKKQLIQILYDELTQDRLFHLAEYQGSQVGCDRRG